MNLIKRHSKLLMLAGLTVLFTISMPEISNAKHHMQEHEQHRRIEDIDDEGDVRDYYRTEVRRHPPHDKVKIRTTF